MLSVCEIDKYREQQIQGELILPVLSVLAHTHTDIITFVQVEIAMMM